MSRYEEKMNQIQLTEEGKEELMRRVKEEAEGNKVMKFGKLTKLSAVAAVVGLMSVTAYATGILEPVSDILAPIFGLDAVQTEIINRIGRPLNASATANGITITAEAILGDQNNVCVVFKVANEDGTPLVLPEPEKMDSNYIMPDMGAISDLPIQGGSHGTIRSMIGEDGHYRMIEIRSTDVGMPIGKKVTATIENLVYFDENGNKQTLAEGKWKLKYAFDYEDASVSIPVNQTFERAGDTFSVDAIHISPIAILVDYEFDTVPEFATVRFPEFEVTESGEFVPIESEEESIAMIELIDGEGGEFITATAETIPITAETTAMKDFMGFDLREALDTLEQEHAESTSTETITTVEVMELPDTTTPSEIKKDSNFYLSDMELFITKADGTIIDLSYAGGGMTFHSDYTTVHKGTVFEEILPLSDVVTIQIGDIEVDVAKYLEGNGLELMGYVE